LKKKNTQFAAYCIRKKILYLSYICNQSTHIGGALSIVDILTVLYSELVSKKKNKFILSKGHGFLALLSTLNYFGYISNKHANTYQQNGSHFIAHPIASKKYFIESSNGSLGQGLSFGCGIAIANKIKCNNEKVYVLIGDGECYEGSIWESAITATEKNLDNLFVIIDSNNFQNDGMINKKMNFKNLALKWKGFGWNVKIINGHNIKSISKSLVSSKINKPTIIIAKTKKGKGVKFMENNNDWHHARLTKNLYLSGLKLLKKNYDKKN